MGRITAITFIKNATTKVIITVFLVLAGLSLTFIVFSYRAHIAAAKEREFMRLNGATRPLANSIDPVQHERIYQRYADNGTLDADSASEYFAIHEQLLAARRDHELTSDVYTLVKDPGTRVFRFMATSGSEPYFKHRWERPHAENSSLYEQGAAFGPYTDENGTWLSVFHPIKLNGRTVAVVQADKQFDPFLTEARATFKNSLLLYLSVFLLTASLLARWMFRILNREETMKERLQRTAELLQERNEDIMASLRAADRIQQAVLPDIASIRRVLPSFGVLYLPKDVVSGDFYWHERVGDSVYLAAGDCTGHGVPGAMMSMMASSALYTVLHQHEGRLDHMMNALDANIRRTWQHDDENSAGMDMSLCYYNTATGRFSYSSAMRPVIMVRNGQAIKLEADRAGIGSPWKTPTFIERDVMVRPGDRFYLYSDGFVDQSGGTKGKRYRTDRFNTLLLGVQERSLEEQMFSLQQEFRIWSAEHAQVDDVLVMGFEIPAHLSSSESAGPLRKSA